MYDPTDTDAGSELDAPTYGLFWRNKFLTAEAQTLEDMILALQSAADELREMLMLGVELDPSFCPDDFAVLITDSAQVAERFGFYVLGVDEELEDEELEDEELEDEW